MTRQIRNSVFETNSSSSHSLTMKPGDLVAQPFCRRVLREGILSLPVGEFGWEYRRYYSVRNKAQYLLTQVTRGRLPEVEDITAELLSSNSQFAMLHRVIKEQTGVAIQVEKSEGYIDHDSEGVGMSLFSDEAKLKDFLFSCESYIETSNDNSGYPFHIRTDRGLEQPYDAAYATPEAGSVPVKFKVTEWFQSFISKRGDEIEMESPLMDEIRQKGVVTAIHWINVDTWRHSYYGNRSGSASKLSNERFRFTDDFSVNLECRLPKEGEERSETAVVTMYLPQELATRFASVRH